MATTKTETISKELKTLTPSIDDIKSMAKVGFTVMTGLYIAEIGARIFGSIVTDKLPDVPYVSNKTVGSGVTALGLWIGYKHVPKTKIPFVNMDTKEVMKYACAGAFARTLGGLTVDILQQLNVNPLGLTGKIEEIME